MLHYFFFSENCIDPWHTFLWTLPRLDWLNGKISQNMKNYIFVEHIGRFLIPQKMSMESRTWKCGYVVQQKFKNVATRSLKKCDLTLI